MPAVRQDRSVLGERGRRADRHRRAACSPPVGVATRRRRRRRHPATTRTPGAPPPRSPRLAVGRGGRDRQLPTGAAASSGRRAPRRRSLQGTDRPHPRGRAPRRAPAPSTRAAPATQKPKARQAAGAAKTEAPGAAEAGHGPEPDPDEQRHAIVKVAEQSGMGERARGHRASRPRCRRASCSTWPATRCRSRENYQHEGSGSDHDSVGLFQQRSSVRLGPVKDLMTPTYSAGAFLDALVAGAGLEEHARCRRPPRPCRSRRSRTRTPSTSTARQAMADALH